MISFLHKIRYISLCFSLFIFFGKTEAQDIHLSQFYEVPILQNPALAGIFTGDYRINALYRNQWASITTPYQTGMLSGEAKFPIGSKDDYLTGGLQLDFDAAGTTGFKTTQVLPVINYHKSLMPSRDMYLSMGFMGGFTQKRVDPSKLTFDNQYVDDTFDPTNSTGETFARYNYSYLDLATGLSLNSRFGENTNWYVGVAFYHFNKPKSSFFDDPEEALKPKWQFNGGLSSTPTDFSKVILYFNMLQQGNLSEIMFGGLYGYAIQISQGAQEHLKRIYGGMFVRWEDALIPTVRVELDEFDIGLSYDVNISKATKASKYRGGYELSVSYKGFFNRPNSSVNALICPKF